MAILLFFFFCSPVMLFRLCRCGHLMYDVSYPCHSMYVAYLQFTCPRCQYCNRIHVMGCTDKSPDHKSWSASSLEKDTLRHPDTIRYRVCHQESVRWNWLTTKKKLDNLAVCSVPFCDKHVSLFCFVQFFIAAFCRFSFKTTLASVAVNRTRAINRSRSSSQKTKYIILQDGI